MQNPRTKFVIVISAIAMLTVGWITVGTGSAEVPFVSIADLTGGVKSSGQQRFRLGGRVEEGSIRYAADHLTVEFVLQQADHRLPVRFRGLAPDMFRDDAEVIVEGEYLDERLLADNLMTKCASRYEVELTEGAASDQMRVYPRYSEQ